jgi:hypothetical protein
MDDYSFPHLHITFHVEAVKNEAASQTEGRPIFDDVEFVTIKFVGDKHNELVAPAHSFGSVRNPDTNERLTYAQQFWKHYEAFQRNMEMRESGSPLEELGLSQAKIKELNASNVYTVEGLAGLDGTFLQKLGMGARDLKTKAEQYLARVNDHAGYTKLEAENADLKARLERMEALMAGKASESDPAPAEYDTTKSPFADWDADTIKLWLEEQGAPTPHGRTGLPKLIQIADEWNAKLEQDKKAA